MPAGVWPGLICFIFYFGMEKALEFTGEFDAELFDRIIQSFYSPEHPEHKRAEEVLLQFRDHPDSWARTASIMKESKDLRSKLFGLQALERTVRVRWSLLAEAQKEGVREYVVETILEYAVKGAERQEAELLLKQLNMILIEIIKREWPEKWPTLIPDLLAASRGECWVCQNTFELLGTLVDAVFNEPKNLVSKQVEYLQRQLRSEFPAIFELTVSILEKVAAGDISVPSALIVSSLTMLEQMLPQVPLGYLLEQGTAELLCKYVETQFNAGVLRIFRELLEREAGEAEQGRFIEAVRKVFVHTSAFAEKYFQEFEKVYQGRLRGHYSALSERDTTVVKELVLFFTAAYGHSKQLEKLGCNTVSPLGPMLEMSEVEDSELFRLCSEFWHRLVKELYLEFPFSPAPAKQPAGLRRARYAGVLPKVARVMVLQMSRPEEVLIREDDDGELVLEKLSETEQLAHCREMKETLFNISSLISGGLSSFLLAEAQQLFGRGWSRTKANKTAWSIGAVAESMSASDEREFLIQSLNVFIRLCDSKTDPVDRGIIASCILYIISQNPKFLQTYWKFLQITTVKVFEFMEEEYTGIPDMACETLLTIASKCGREYEVVHEKQERPMVDELLPHIPRLLGALANKAYLLELVYEAFCYMVGGRAEALLNYTLGEIFSPELGSVEGVQRCLQAIRRVKVVCRVQSSEEFAAGRERAMKGVIPQLQQLYENPAVAAPAKAGLQRWMESLKRELLELFGVVAREFSMEFIRGGFIETVSQLVLGPLSSGREFAPGELAVLSGLCQRSVDLTHSLVDAVAPSIAKRVINDPVGNEELMKAFYQLVCTSVKSQPHPSALEVVEWLAFGASQPHREVSEGCIEVIADILNRGSLEMIRVGYFGLLECVVGAALDKDHDGGKNALIEALSTLTRYSIEEKCASQMEVLNIFGSRLHQTFPHLSYGDIEEFVYRCYENVNSHDELAKNIDDFRVKIGTI